ncbi:MAG: hypothetical protein JKY48_06655 [Flavobacteriales bacterium]|nr:hypothetical protein [Flavobacteriales bacterium]
MLHRIPQNIITSASLLLIGLVGLWFSIGTEKVSFVESTYSLLDGVLLEGLVLSKLVYLAGVVLCLCLGVQINNEHKFVEGNKFLLLVFCFIGYPCFYFFEIQLSSVVGVLFSMLSLYFLLKIHNQNSVLGLIFMSTFFIGLASLFLYPTLIQLLTVLLSITFFRPFELRNYVMMFVGFSLPVFYFYSFSYLLGFEFYIPEFGISSFSFEHDLTVGLVPILFLIIISGIASAKLFSSRTKFIVRQRNQFLIIVCFIMLQGFLWLLIPAAHVIITVLPLTGIFFLYLYKKATKKWLLDVFLLLLLSSIIWVKTLV